MDKKIPLHFALLGLAGIAVLLACAFFSALLIPDMKKLDAERAREQAEVKAEFEAMSYSQVVAARRQYTVFVMDENGDSSLPLCGNTVYGQYYCQDLTIKITNNSDVALPVLTMMVYREVLGYGTYKNRYSHRFDSPLMPGESTTVDVETEASGAAIINYDRLWIEVEPNINKVVRHLYPELTGKY